LSCAVAGAVDAVFEVQVDHGDDAGDVDAFEVADAAAVVGGCLELGELGLGDFPLADGPVVVLLLVGEDVDVGVGVVVVVAADGSEGTGEDGGSKECGEDGGG